MNTPPITSHLVPEHARMDTVDRILGIGFVLKFEPCLYNITGQLSSQYTGGYWEIHTLSNGGLWMNPRTKKKFAVRCQNGFEGTMSAEALGITSCLYSYSLLSFETGTFAETMAEHFQWLRAFACSHPDARAILSAID
ncbi:MAG: antirestriction protein [Burkholderiales bacterium]|nr:antirestriction protein [Burkholderiales bacterium]